LQSSLAAFLPFDKESYLGGAAEGAKGGMDDG